MQNKVKHCWVANVIGYCVLSWWGTVLQFYWWWLCRKQISYHMSCKTCVLNFFKEEELFLFYDKNIRDLYLADTNWHSFLTEWNPKQTRLLFELYKKHIPLLGCDNCSLAYHKKSDMWKAISLDFLARGHKFTTEQLANKWKSMERSLRNKLLRLTNNEGNENISLSTLRWVINKISFIFQGNSHFTNKACT